MKKGFKLFGMMAFAAMVVLSSCKKDDEDTVVTPTPTPAGMVELSGELSTQTLTADKKYLLKGQVFVREGQVLTIEPGTVVFGDKATRATLIIDKGGRLEANGTASQPIVFTSAQPAGIRDRGDWGGLVILGRANNNQIEPAIEGINPAVTFGTNNNTANDDDSSGTLKFVRVEFAGIELTPNNETNSITFGGVGRGTTVENCQVSFGGDDGFEWFGGTVNAKNLVSFATWDDDFDCDYGWSGNVQYGVVIRYPSFADQSQSNAFECDNGPNDNDVQPYTTGTFSNVTVVGPIKTGTSTSNANYAHAIDLRRRTSVSIFNSVFLGFPSGVRMNQPSVVANYQGGSGVLANNVLVAPNSANAYKAGSGVDVSDVTSLWTANNQTIDGPASDDITSGLGLNTGLFFGSRLPESYTAPIFSVTSGTLASGASFENAKFSEANRAGFFDNVSFKGAFGASDWTQGWTEFNPVNAAY
jgi:hypothetical protein